MEQEKKKKRRRKEYWRKYYLKNKKLLIEKQKGKYVKIPKLKGRKEKVYADGSTQEIQKQVPQMMDEIAIKILNEKEVKKWALKIVVLNEGEVATTIRTKGYAKDSMSDIL